MRQRTPTTKTIQDEFSKRRDISRQRKYQLRRVRDGRCARCGKPRDGVRSNFCESCREKTNAASRELMRKKAAAAKGTAGADGTLSGVS